MASTYLQSGRMKAIKYCGPEGKKSIQANPLPLYRETFFSIPPRTALSNGPLKGVLIIHQTR